MATATSVRKPRASAERKGTRPERTQIDSRISDEPCPSAAGPRPSETMTMTAPAMVGTMRRRHHGAACVTSSSEPEPGHAIDCTSAMKCTHATAPMPAMMPVSGTSTQKRRDGGDSSRR